MEPDKHIPQGSKPLKEGGPLLQYEECVKAIFKNIMAKYHYIGPALAMWDAKLKASERFGVGGPKGRRPSPAEGRHPRFKEPGFRDPRFNPITGRGIPLVAESRASSKPYPDISTPRRALGASSGTAIRTDTKSDLVPKPAAVPSPSHWENRMSSATSRPSRSQNSAESRLSKRAFTSTEAPSTTNPKRQRHTTTNPQTIWDQSLKTIFPALSLFKPLYATDLKPADIQRIIWAVTTYENAFENLQNFIGSNVSDERGWCLADICYDRNSLPVLDDICGSCRSVEAACPRIYGSIGGYVDLRMMSCFPEGL